MICGVAYMDGRTAEAGTLQRMFGAMIEPGLNAKPAYLLSGPAALGVADFSGHEPVLNPVAGGTVLVADALSSSPGHCPAHCSVEGRGSAACTAMQWSMYYRRPYAGGATN